jgi:hypothetical protein
VDGVFMSQDPLGFGGGQTNTEEYVGNSPTNGTDPTGDDAYDGGPTPSLNDLADRLPHFQQVSPENSVRINAYETGFGQCADTRLSQLVEQRRQEVASYDPGNTSPGYGERWAETLTVYDAEILECRRVVLAKQGIGILSGGSGGGTAPVWQLPPLLPKWFLHGGGLIGTGDAEIGMGPGAAAQGFAGAGLYTNGAGVFYGSGTLSPDQFDIGPGKNKWVYGGYVGAGMGVFLTNATNNKGLDGDFQVYNLNVGEGPFKITAGLGVDDNGTWQFTFGPPATGVGHGVSVSAYHTTTYTLGW